MAKIFKISGYLIDPHGKATSGFIRDILLVKWHHAKLHDQHLHIVEREIENWNDRLPINKVDCDLAECEKYFIYDNGWPIDTDRSISLGGEKYRHFKGKIVEVAGISQDAETPGQFAVIYKDEDGYVWHRPLGMFLSEVDHKKYPDVKQKYRFELVED